MSVEPIGKMVGRLGELLVEQQLLERGWHPVRLDTAQLLASKADLLAIKGKYRVSPQVKTTNAKSEHSHSQVNWLTTMQNSTLDSVFPFRKACP